MADTSSSLDSQLIYEAKLNELKKMALVEIGGCFATPFNTRQKDEIDTILHTLISSTIVLSGGSLQPWKEKAK